MPFVVKVFMPNLYFLFGNDEFAITRKLKEFKSDFTDPNSADMNTARLEARSMDENDLNNPLQNMTTHPQERNFLSSSRNRQRPRAWSCTNLLNREMLKSIGW